MKCRISVSVATLIGGRSERAAKTAARCRATASLIAIQAMATREEVEHLATRGW
jgi:hypothetical protein